VFFNPQQLTTASVGGNTQALIAIDDRSGYISVLGSKSKDKHDIMTCLEELIVTYNARNHHVTAFCSDSEAICHSLATLLGLFHAHITHTTPDAHCHKVERAIQQIGQKATTILEGAVSIASTSRSSICMIGTVTYILYVCALKIIKCSFNET